MRINYYFYFQKVFYISHCVGSTWKISAYGLFEFDQSFDPARETLDPITTPSHCSFHVPIYIYIYKRGTKILKRKLYIN